MGQTKRGDRDVRGIGARVGGATLLLALVLCAMFLAAPAVAKEVRVSLGTFGSAAQPSFNNSRSIAVDQSTHDLYVAGFGKSERQTVTVSATAGKFKLKFKGETTAELAFNAGSGSVRSALRALPSLAPDSVEVTGGPGDGPGSKPYVILFQSLLEGTDVEQLECLNGATPLSGGSGCAVTTIENGAPATLSRWNADGTPSEFSALGSNAIDGVGPGEDQVPTNHLQQINGVAVDNSGGATDGDVYVAEGSFHEDNSPALHVVYAFAPSGKYLGQLTEYEEGPTASGPLKPLNPPCGLAVDGAGDLYVGDNTISGGLAHLTIHKYDPTANPPANADNVANFAAGALNTTSCRLAAGAGPTNGYIFSLGTTGEGGEPEVLKLDAASGAKQYALALSASKNLQGATGVMVDPATGRVLASVSLEPRGIYEYDASGAGAPLPSARLPLARPLLGMALDGASGDLYLSSSGSSHLDVYGPLVTVPDVTIEAASGIGPDAATLHGTISAAEGPEAHCHFQYLTEATYQAQLKAAQEASKVEPKTDAEVADAAFAGAQSASCSPAGPFTGSGLNAVSANLEGLAHETAYRFRLVGVNANGQNPSEGNPPFFETFGRPKVKGGSVSEATTTSAKISGEVNPGGQATSFAVQYVSEADFKASGYNNALSAPEPAEAIGSGASFLEVSAQLAGLAPHTAYRFRIAATNADGTTLGKEGTFASFAPPEGLLDGRARELVNPAARPTGEVFTQEAGPRGGLGGSCKVCTPGWNNRKAPMQSSPDGDAVAYEGDPFHTGLAAEANSYVSRHGEAGWQTAALSEPQFEAQDFKGFSPDLSKAVIEQAEPPLTPEAPAGYDDLYLREEGGGLTTLIKTKPPSRTTGTTGSNPFQVDYAGGNAGTKAVPAFSHIVFQANDALTEAAAGIAPKAPTVKAEETDLYEWSNGQLHLVNVLPGNEKAAPNAVIGSGLLLSKGGSDNFDFDHAISGDGSRVFWSESSSGQVYVRVDNKETLKVPDPGKFLTATPSGSKALLSDGKLYDLESKTLTDLTGGAGGFEGMAGASEDLSRVYFVDSKALTPPEAENANEEHAEAGKFNLYLSEEGALVFIAKLAAADGETGDQVGVWRAAPGNRLAQVTADGRYLAFESTQSLSGYDNLVQGTKTCLGSGTEGSPVCYEVFLYDALGESLVCASCNPSGQRPRGGSNLSLIETAFEFLPQPRNLSPKGEGRLFFESRDTLTPADTNGRVQDVYEYEPEGVGGCARAKGCLSLISSGKGPKDSWFIDASATGDDAFFATHDQLLPADQNDFMDLYDARAGGGIEEPPLPTPCEGEGCKGPAPVTPEEPDAGSSTLQVEEPPPPRPCAKGKVRRHGKCLKRPRRHRHAHRKRGGNR
ncbi:MAG TPA: hypothetical protein VFJ64_08735 [Solirubrobacterales bacterium]|nr:hypothetical protein [Solirubrobacterales bacterium]